MMRSRLVHALAIILSFCRYGSCGWMLSATKWPALFMGGGGGDDVDTSSAATAITSEVVGAAGRMGSLWLQQQGSVAVSRGISPGCLSAPSTPIYVTTPSKSWRQVYKETLDPRKNDLVWVGNGLLLPEFENSTVIVPHYGILSIGAAPVTSSSSPPTFCHGKHAQQAAEVLEGQGIQTRIVTSWNDIQTRAAQKLLWASCMWLLCHSNGAPPLTVEQVHDEKQADLEELVRELLPALELIVGVKVDLEETLVYLEAYSRSMVGAIPSKELAMSEVKERNGVWLQLRSSCPQPFHEKLLERIGGSKLLEQTIEQASSAVEGSRQCVHLKDVDLSLWGVKGSNEPCRNAIVIGGGIVGSSIALNLARRGINVTLLDRQAGNELGVTTAASWAWINANNKSPPPYQWLNQLGMRSWRKDSIVMNLPIWNGALVQYKQDPLFLFGYAREGPLSSDRIKKELEPQSNFSLSDGPVYFFADEGCVDPAKAVHSMRQAAKDLGVSFKFGQNVTALIRDGRGKVVGVESCHVSSPSDKANTLADVVVVAAGCGSSSPALGGLPLTHSPGQIAFARPSSSSPSLKRILVDTVRESHVLQRQDGTLVAGGGFLEVGGTPSTSKESQGIAYDRGGELLDVASQLAPCSLKGAIFQHSATAVRPMPQDGFPAVGYLEPGLYSVVTHSGVTLAPLLGPLAALEIGDGFQLDTLQPFRPTRLFQKDTSR